MGKPSAIRSTAAAAAVAGIAFVVSAAAPAKTREKETAALELVRAELKDPASAQFKGVKPMGDKGGFCGWVNARNSYGGYTGFGIFYVSSEGKVAILPPELSDEKLCP